jgi:hypothetical protein
MILEESVCSLSNSISRPELASCGPEIEHRVLQFLPLLFAFAMKTCVSLWVTR